MSPHMDARSPTLRTDATGREPRQDFHKLMVWNKAHAVVLDVYAATRAFPASERYGLQAQVRRSASSIATNLAEGSGRNTAGGFAAYVETAFASANETKYHLLVSRDTGLMPEETYLHIIRDLNEIQRMLAALHKTLQARAARFRRRH